MNSDVPPPRPLKPAEKPPSPSTAEVVEDTAEDEKIESTETVEVRT